MELSLDYFGAGMASWAGWLTWESRCSPGEPLRIVKAARGDFRTGSPFSRCRSKTIRMVCNTGN
jgi:hypothetical protein